MPVYRNYVEKKESFRTESEHLCSTLRTELGLSGLQSVRVINRYDIEGIDEQLLPTVRTKVLGEPAVDVVSDDIVYDQNDAVFAVSYLPGQFDQRADSCEQCISLITCQAAPKVVSARVYVLSGELSAEDVAAVKKYLINPVESCEVTLERFETLAIRHDEPEMPPVIEGFCSMKADQLDAMRVSLGLAMDNDDLEFCRRYFAEDEKRDPTLTEIRMIDTYWSDHCRHTTFSTELVDIKIEDERVQAAFDNYLKMRETVYGEKAKTRPVTLMDIATIGGKYLRKVGKLQNMDVSEEINACSVRIRPEIDGKPEDWLLMFKNETHNHPTEIEPFGGAATCLGGAIRDPLSGRAYVYQAMRVTGAGNPNTPYDETLPNKLPQRKICTGAADGYSSYGNQIGLATGLVSEIYHPGYVAKRLETGAVIAAAPARNVVREEPAAGDVVILLGGKTGRDGCGGATGSSKAHNVDSLSTCGAEVQKGNPPTERKIQRLFRNAEVTTLIKRCNDFGAGGVSVAVGELADGLEINLDAVPKKYDGLDGTELAISESQERMAVVVAAKDVDKFVQLAQKENLETTPVAVVTDRNRLNMTWQGKQIVSLSRDFLNTNGARKEAAVLVSKPVEKAAEEWTSGLGERLLKTVSDLNAASQKGLVERFDGSIGAGSVFLPFGGKNAATPMQSMVGLLPVLGGKTKDCSVMSYGFNADISSHDPFFGAMNAVVSSVAKVVATGARIKNETENCWLSLQEFFCSTKGKPERWALPFAALLGALTAQVGLGLAAIGGKDSMSGTFENIDVPPTLISFAVSTAKADKVISPEFKKAGSGVYLVVPAKSDDLLKAVEDTFDVITDGIACGNITAAYSLSDCSAAEAVCKMAFGNDIGVELSAVPCEQLFWQPVCGGFIVEADEAPAGAILLGKTIDRAVIATADGDVELKKLRAAWDQPLEKVYPTKAETGEAEPVIKLYTERNTKAPAIKTARPTVFIPVFPGTNCEYDIARRFAENGADTNICVVRNLTPADIEASVEAMTKGLQQAQILAIPGGFSGGDEPDGSAKFITAFFNNPRIGEAVMQLLYQRDGLALGICNGFQALVKTGLVPFGDIRPMADTAPTLFHNLIGRHQSVPVRLQVASVKSPW
ncbi:MAG: phosphoribosylformylglycinamidine synthase, partial [Clostridia bacterium]|nr:phosphoribosylformylglycinamidine synthase [Clostridia bacterium]